MASFFYALQNVISTRELTSRRFLPLNNSIALTPINHIDIRHEVWCRQELVRLVIKGIVKGICYENR